MHGITLIHERLRQRRHHILCLWSFSVFFPFAFLLAQEYPHAVSVNANIISSSKLFTSPLSADPAEKNSAIVFGTMLNARVAYSYAFTPTMRLQLGGEIVTAEDAQTDNNETTITDGYTIYTAELATLFVLPFTGKTFEMFIGGGAGAYWGTRKHTVANVSANPQSSTPSFNILTVIGAEYFLSSMVSLAAEWRFRDPVVTAVNAFTPSSIVSNGITYPLEQRPFTSKINVNGNAYSLGVSLHF